MTPYEQECWNKYYDWCSLIPGYAEMAKNQKKAAKKKYKENNMQLQLEVVECISTSTLEYDDDYRDYPKKKKEMNMNTLEHDQKRYAHNRLYEIYENKLLDLRRKFGLADDRDPSTPEELIERIKAGKYTIREDRDGWSYSPYGCIRWRDPELKEDKNGYKDARDELEKVLSSYKDRAWLGTNEETLKTLQEFEAL